jgi:hypothetical protein
VSYKPICPHWPAAARARADADEPLCLHTFSEAENDFSQEDFFHRAFPCHAQAEVRINRLPLMFLLVAFLVQFGDCLLLCFQHPDALARVLSFERQFRVGYAEAFSTPRQALRDHCRTHLLCFFG